MSKILIYHNPKCSKSRQTLQLLRDHGVEPLIVEYLKTPPTQKTIKELLALLKVGPRAIIRDNEPEYKDLGLNDETLSDPKLIKALAENPKLLQRPIVIHNKKAVIGRPPENVLEIL